MTGRERGSGVPQGAAARIIGGAAGIVLRYGLVVIVLWFGAFKFTDTEAAAIQPLVANSPPLAWLNAVMSQTRVSQLIGLAEITIAVLIALRPLSARLALIGSGGAVVMFVTTLSFLFTTPGMWTTVEGLFVPSGGGAFVIKDLVLLGAALWSVAEALEASRPPVADAGIAPTNG